METTFSNNLILLEDIPLIETVTYEPLERAYLKIQKIWFFILMPVFGACLITSFFFIEQIQYIWLMIAVGLAYVLVGLLYWVGEDLSFRYSGYAIREHDLLFKSGWWVQQVRLVPFNRVQHLSIEAGMLERRYKLASLHIYTAGSAEADFTLYGVKREIAEKVKDFINIQIRNTDIDHA